MLPCSGPRLAPSTSPPRDVTGGKWCCVEMVRNVAIATVTYTEMTDISGESPAPIWLPASPQVIGALVSQGPKSQMQVTGHGPNQGYRNSRRTAEL